MAGCMLQMFMKKKAKPQCNTRYFFLYFEVTRIVTPISPLLTLFFAIPPLYSKAFYNTFDLQTVWRLSDNMHFHISCLRHNHFHSFLYCVCFIWLFLIMTHSEEHHLMMKISGNKCIDKKYTILIQLRIYSTIYKYM